MNKIHNKKRIYLFVERAISSLCLGMAFFLLAGTQRVHAQNLALHCPYQMSPAPNYPLTTSASDRTDLTDGKFSAINFWSKEATIGWNRKQKISVKLDLKQSAPVGKVVISTGQRKPGSSTQVHYPANLYVFMSRDGSDWTYEGDAADLKNKSVRVQNRDYGKYDTRKYILQNIDQLYRYVKLVIIPDGRLVFVDEVEVLKSNRKKRAVAREARTKNTDAFVDSLKIKQDRQAHLAGVGNEMVQWMRGTTAEKGNVTVQADEDDRSITEKYGAYLANNYNTAFIVEKVNPWASFSGTHRVRENPGQLNYTYSIPVKGVQYGAFVITNSSIKLDSLTIEIRNSNSGSVNLHLYQVPLVPTTEGSKMVADPLVPLSSFIKIEPGLSQLFFFQLEGKEKGVANIEINVRGAGKDVKVNIQSTGVDVFSNPNGFTLNANTWAYLTYPMLKDRKEAAVQDLKAHHINTVVVPPWKIPQIGSNNFKKLVDYLHYFGSPRYVLLRAHFEGAKYRDGLKAGKFLSSEWKESFRGWYATLLKVLRQNGLSNTAILFYPYDEPRDQKTIEEYKKLIVWAKRAVPGIKFFSTLVNNTQAIRELLPLVDIVQINNVNQFIKKLPAHQTEAWLYENGSPARSLPPYGHYRLMAWRAFESNAKGIGFWNYADEKNGRKLNLMTNPLFSSAGSYSVVYDGPGKSIISTRRWEAFKLGIEDYEIISLYAQKVGSAEASVLVEKVLKNPDDLGMADEVRNKMQKQLINLKEN